jgi:hypothetical protein
MPLCFNMLIPLMHDLELATAVFRRLLPNVIHQVTGIRFETSPLPRRDPRGLADGTAFDAAVDAVDPDGVPITCFIEIKYSEDMFGPAARLRETYDIRSREVRLFVDPDSPTLRNLGQEQLWREMMLAQVAVDRGITPRAHFIAIGPRLNRRVQVAFQCFANQLILADDRDDDRVGFTPLTLEDFIEATSWRELLPKIEAVLSSRGRSSMTVFLECPRARSKRGKKSCGSPQGATQAEVRYSPKLTAEMKLRRARLYAWR